MLIRPTNGFLLILAAVVFLGSGGNALAAALKGTVQAVGFSSLRVITDGNWSQEEIRVNGDTAYDGVDNLKGLSQGDQVAVTFDTINKAKIASSIQKIQQDTGVPPTEALLDQPTPSPSEEPSQQQ